jgi:hypothetical protein
MEFPSYQYVLKRLIENERASQKVRLKALAEITRPPLSLLLRVLNDPRSCSRLLALAAKRYKEECVRRDLRLQAKRRKRGL